MTSFATCKPIEQEGLHHAISLGNIETSAKSNSYQVERCYDSEDENMGRRRTRTQSPSDLYHKTSVYSKGDIREQYCLTDRQLNTIERPRRERFFGCFSSRGAPQSFLGVCVGRRAPSDENIADYAPFYKYPRYHHHCSPEQKPPEDDQDSSYFRRQPASILITAKCGTSNDNAPDRYSWIEPTQIIDDSNLRPKDLGFQQEAFIVRGYKQPQYLNHNSEHITCVYRCPAHVGLPPPPPPPTNAPSGPPTPRTKHVSFARSHTLTSFDEASLRSSGRMKGARSQERLIGGKKPIMNAGPIYEPAQHPTAFVTRTSHHHIIPHPHQHTQIIQQPAYHIHHPNQILVPMHQHELVAAQHHPTNEELISMMQVNRGSIAELNAANMGNMSNMGNMGSIATAQKSPSAAEVILVEKIKRNAMKTQATQTEGYAAAKKEGVPYNLALSPRTVHRVKVVSQGAQTNGILNGRKLTKSLSEMNNGRAVSGQSGDYLSADKHKLPIDHEQLHRTQSEEPPRSPSMTLQNNIGEEQTNIKYYEPPPPINISSHLKAVNANDLYMSNLPRKQSQESVYSFRATDNESALSMSNSSRQHHHRGPEDHSQQSQHVSRSRSSSQSIHASQSIYGPGYDGSSNAGSVTDYEGPNFDFERNSLPRRACGQHRLDVETYTHSLPRRDTMQNHESCRHITECPELLSDGVREYRGEDLLEKLEIHRQSWSEQRRSSMTGQRASDNAFSRDSLRRKSMPMQPFIIPFPGAPTSIVKTKISESKMHAQQQLQSQPQPQAQPQSLPVVISKKEEPKPEPEEEKEIFIDFKPHASPKPSPKINKKKLTKTSSDGEILHERRRRQEAAQKEAVHLATISTNHASSSTAEEEDNDEHLYQNLPLKDVKPIPTVTSLSPPDQPKEGSKRDMFRKRSISLEDPNTSNEARLAKSAPPSPCQEELLANTSTYPSSDSLANDLTRDHSDGLWNDSQVTVVTVEPREESDKGSTSHLLTPSSKRKNLLLQHQQRSSIDTDFIDFDEQMSDHSPTFLVPPKPMAIQVATSKGVKDPTQSKSLTVPCLKQPSPTIAVTPTIAIRAHPELPSPVNIRRLSRTMSPAPDPIYVSNRFLDTSITVTSQMQPEYHIYSRRDSSVKTNNTDLSECSTNTDEYITCTDTSRRTPVSAQSSQTERTHDGSSFESASSLYSTRGDGLSEDAPTIDEQLPGVLVQSPLSPKSEMVKQSPSHSICSTSSGSYNIAGGQSTQITPLKEESPPLPIAVSPPKTVTIAPRQSVASSSKGVSATSSKQGASISVKKKAESVSDDERSEKRYSSSGYYESPPHEEDPKLSKFRRHRAEEDRRRRKSSMKLDIERENLRALTSPIKKTVLSPKPVAQVSPEGQLTTNTNAAVATTAVIATIDGASPSKMKRFRPKIRRQFRRSSRDECTPRKQKAISVPGRSSDYKPPPPPQDVATITSPLKSSQSSGNQLKAKSIESLRSVSPGSDSVFYSEADGGVGIDQQVHCLHCGKEVEIVNASGSQESIAAIEQDDDELDIVKPPADFADSPVTTKTSQRLYKKMDKRFRSEERHGGDRGRHYKSRQENIRAKSEERGKDNSSQSPPVLRPAGSSPCVLPNETVVDKDQCVYRGNYDNSRYTRLTDIDVWIQLDHQTFDRQRDRRGSTESEKNFHSKYQVILHRLVQRRCTLEMYHRQKTNSFILELISKNSTPEPFRRKLEEVFKLMLVVWAREAHVLAKLGSKTNEIDKTIVVKSDSGEFGFRIHGSKPVVVAAIEPDTPAESSGLEVGDIIISVNGVSVLDKHHTEVVKIAHAGCETLELEVARTIGVLMNEKQDSPRPIIQKGYLWRQSGHAKGIPNPKKWVRRWFCLRPDHCLYYYKTEDDTQPVGAIILAKHTIERCDTSVGKPFAFKIEAGEGIPMYLAADTEDILSRWITTMRHSATQADPWLDMSSRNLKLPPGGIDRPDCFGYLMKLGSRWCGWSKRYCVLKDACLYFYQDANSKVAFGMACLQGFKVASMSTNSAGRKNSFEIIPPESKLRHYYFSTESEMDKKRWISALEYSIDRWIKTG
ncbi:uncharacterized protein LOC129906427 [Episyrphus balteatus]|uniref:uncharacterized protein LOC129906427 n=1 Tax=Episyrphus balteatus TaxID=286459 RepID=UPI0024863C50|nr:uncharacterized protein LOC129906427 [Episyrphus balteatus]